MAENHPIKPEEKQNAPIQKNEKPITDEHNLVDKPDPELEKIYHHLQQRKCN